MKAVNLLGIVGVITCVAMAVRADDVTWRGVNTTAIEPYARTNWLTDVTATSYWWKAGYDASVVDPATLATNASVDGGNYSLWSNGRVPGTNDTARFVWNNVLLRLTNGALAVARDVVIDGDFSPGSIYHHSENFYVPGSDLLIRKHLALQTIYYQSGWTSATKGQFLVGDGYSITLTGGPRPFTFAGYQGGWHGIVLGTGSTLAFTGADVTFDSFYYTPYSDTGKSLGGSAGYLTFSNANATITLGQPPQGSLRPAIAVGANQLRVHAGQTWLNPSGAGYIYIAPADEDTLVQSIDGGALSNLSSVAFRFDAGNQNASDFYVPAGSYQGFSLYSYETSGDRLNYFRLTGDVELAGGAAVYDSAVTNLTQACAYGLYYEANSRYVGSEVCLGGHALTLARGIMMQKGSNVNETAGQISLDASGSTLTIGGDLVYREIANFAGCTNTSGVLTEGRRIGVYGDTNTVVNLYGNFISNTRSSNRRGGNGLYRSTVNLLGGTVGQPHTFEVGSAPGDLFTSNTYAIGRLQIGSVSEPGNVRLVNDSLNDNDAANPKKSKSGEILVARRLTVGAGSVLDLNGLGVKLDVALGSPALEIASSGWLDLNTGLALAVGDTVPTFAGLGNQTTAWRGVQSRVRDSSQGGVRFVPKATKAPLPFGDSSHELRFDGTNDYVDLRTNGDGLGTQITNANFTIEMWVRAVAGPSANGGYGCLMFRTSSTTTTPLLNTSFYWLGVSGGNYAACVNGNFTAGNTGIAANTNTWRHLALVRDGATQRIYVDGEARTNAPIGATQSTAIGNLGLGSAPTAPAYRPVAGVIAEVRVWNVVRTQAEIQGAMMQRLAGTESGLAAYWPLGEGTGTTAFDGATGVRKGTVSGAAWDTGATYWALAPGGGTLIQVR